MRIGDSEKESEREEWKNSRTRRMDLSVMQMRQES